MEKGERRKIGVYDRAKAVSSRSTMPWIVGIGLVLLILIILLLL
jgi:hypothetical protein